MDYAMFLRGVNVGGIKVESAKLRSVLEGLGFDAVRTYVASGNVTFTSGDAAGTVQRNVEKALSEAFSYDAHVLLYQRAELEGVVGAYPFDPDADHHRYAVLCDSAATATEVAGQAGPDEDVAANGAVVYWRCPKGETLQSSFSKVLAKRTYKQRTTTRNLNTVEKMVSAHS